MKKRRTILIAAIITIAILSVTGCSSMLSETQDGSTSTTLNEEDFMVRIGYVDMYGNIEEWKDTQEGVHYLIYNQHNEGGMCPRYRADGTLYVD